ncbi:MAG TPA: glycine cleavage T C-terminal barrel domain-containing protein [Candidatus Krumholzibacteria bacterium]|nr:glycine cleavage T C-terminal barrel domain-containing protein [Candidatus Krumholzibacteria bacterium]
MPTDTLPDAFTNPATEYEALAHAVGLIDLATAGVLRLTGKDRVRFLNAMITNDVAALATGHMCPALMTTTRGKIVAELLVLAGADDLRVLVLQGPVAQVAESLESHIIADDVTLENLSDAHAMIAVEGPRCRELVWRIFPREPLPLEGGAFTENDYQGMRATVVRHSLVGDKGMLVIVERAYYERMKAYLVQGAVGMDGAEIGGGAWNTRRVENGRPWFGADVTADNFPAECGLESHVSYEKGCYLGQETIARMHYRGHPNWKLVGLSGVDEVPAAGTELVAASGGKTDDATAGRVTSAVFSPMLKGALCLAYVRTPLAVAGAVFHIRGAAAPLTLIDLPLKGGPTNA